jgi:hypothetical protein
MTTSDSTFFERWFDLLARNKFAAALLPISGISIGLFLTMSGHVLPAEFAWFIEFVGASLIATCSTLFLAVATAYVIFCVRDN